MNYEVTVSRYSVQANGWVKAYHYVASSIETAKIIMAKQIEYCFTAFEFDTLSFTLSHGDRTIDSRLQVADADWSKFGMDKKDETLTASCVELSEGTCAGRCPFECKMRSASNPF